MSMKKAKGKGKKSAAGKKVATKTTKKDEPKVTKQIDIVKVRQKIDNLVKASAKGIAIEMIKVAKTGQVAPAKYLFEAVGLYPPTEQTSAKPQGDSLAHTLLKRLGLPTDPVIVEEDPEPIKVMNFAKVAEDEAVGDESGVEKEAGACDAPEAAGSDEEGSPSA